MEFKSQNEDSALQRFLGVKRLVHRQEFRIFVGSIVWWCLNSAFGQHGIIWCQSELGPSSSRMHLELNSCKINVSNVINVMTMVWSYWYMWQITIKINIRLKQACGFVLFIFKYQFRHWWKWRSYDLEHLYPGTVSVLYMRVKNVCPEDIELFCMQNAVQ